MVFKKFIYFIVNVDQPYLFATSNCKVFFIKIVISLAFSNSFCTKYMCKNAPENIYIQNVNGFKMTYKFLAFVWFDQNASMHVHILLLDCFTWRSCICPSNIGSALICLGEKRTVIYVYQYWKCLIHNVGRNCSDV